VGGETPGSAESRPLWMRLAKASFRWDQSATAQTVGIGDDLQSSNPTYDWSFLLSLRYYLYEDSVQKYSIRGSMGLAREFTNNDSTTERGEWTLTDALLTSVYGRQLYSDGEWDTTLTLRAPDLSFPTSKVSASIGKNLGVGGGIGLWQTIPINGSDAKALQNIMVIPSVGYSYTFTDFTEATADNLDLTRMDLNGQSVPTNQLSGVAFAQHQMDISITTDLSITDRFSWGNSFGWRPTWKYEFDAENDDQLCSVVLTGCITPDRLEDRTNYVVVTTFSSELAFRVFDEMTLAVGYNNIAGQIGPDGKRRNMFYSPDARVFLTAIAHIDEIIKTASGGDSKPSSQMRRTALGFSTDSVQ
jgi:hypothetical protein